MIVYPIAIPNGARCFLIDQFFPAEYLAKIHAICDAFTKESSDWANPEWTKYRYIYQGTGSEWDDVIGYLKQPNADITQALGYEVKCDEVIMWAEFQGIGTLQPHVEVPNGKELCQIYITKQPVPNNGTTIYTDDKEILCLLPYRDNFGWFFDNSGQVMHGRDNDVPAGTTRFTMMIHWSKVQNESLHA